MTRVCLVRIQEPSPISVAVVWANVACKRPCAIREYRSCETGCDSQAEAFHGTFFQQLGYYPVTVETTVRIRYVPPFHRSVV